MAHPLVFFSLPLAGPELTERSLGPGDGESYFAVVRYLESAPVVLRVDPPQKDSSGRTIKTFHSDGKYLWGDYEINDIVLGHLRFRPALVEHVLSSTGVCPALSDSTRREAGLAAFDILKSTKPASL